MSITGHLRIDEAIATVRDAAADGLFLAAEHVLGVSNTHVPHEYGDLEGSGTTSEDRGNLEAAVAYNTPYAARQHEDLTLKHDPGRTAKYLENAVNSETSTVARIITDTIHGQLGN